MFIRAKLEKELAVTKAKVDQQHKERVASRVLALTNVWVVPESDGSVIIEGIKFVLKEKELGFDLIDQLYAIIPIKHSFLGFSWTSNLEVYADNKASLLAVLWAYGNGA